MALCTCKCLNIRLQISGEAPKPADRVADCEQRDPFFRESLLSCPSVDVRAQTAQSALQTVRHDGAWTVHVCVACGTHTHATGPDTHTLLNKATQTTPEAVERLKDSIHFSPVFKLLVPEISAEDESKENRDANKLVPAVPSLSQNLSSSLQSQLESIEESIRQFRDQKYAEYERYTERAHRDHKILASIVSKARQAERARATADRPSSPPPPHEFRRRLSSFKGVKKLKQNTVKIDRNMGSEEDSLDSEDIFDLEGGSTSRNGNNSDVDDYDSDDSGSNDEGIHIRGPGRAPPLDPMARSLPVNMPRYSNRVPIPRRQLDDEEDPQDIAASIKALAQSVHADVFGDLPRPRFSTQI